MVPAGSQITYQAQTHTTFLLNSDQVIAGVADILGGNGMSIYTHTESLPGIMAAYLALGYASFTTTMTVEVNGAYNSIMDIQSVVDQAFYQTVGDLPVSTVPSYISGDTNQTIVTGQPSSTGTIPQAATCGILDVIFSNTINGKTCTWSGYLGVVGWTTIIIIIILVIMGLIVFLNPAAPAQVVRSFQS